MGFNDIQFRSWTSGLCFWQSWTFCHSSKSVFGKAFAGHRTFLCKSIHNPKLLLSENNPVIPSLETASLAAISFIISRLILAHTLVKNSKNLQMCSNKTSKTCSLSFPMPYFLFVLGIASSHDSQRPSDHCRECSPPSWCHCGSAGGAVDRKTTPKAHLLAARPWQLYDKSLTSSCVMR